MSLPPVTRISGRAVPVPGDDVDTDRIIPARFMRCITFDGLGEYAFYDARFEEDGTPKAHPLNEERFEGASILIAGANFGCGSSREHAPQALYRYGFKAVLGESFAEIFFGNCTTLGIPCLSLSRSDLEALSALVRANPALEIVLDVQGLTVTAGEKTFPAKLDSTAQGVLVGGKWDPIAELLETPADEVLSTAKAQAYAGVA
jgi:3-isopropylmalate/(R)-2-methylmalate dehydratase small subunit